MGTYYLRRGINAANIAVYSAMYRTADGQEIELARSGTADYPCKLIARLSGKAR